VESQLTEHCRKGMLILDDIKSQQVDCYNSNDFSKAQRLETEFNAKSKEFEMEKTRLLAEKKKASDESGKKCLHRVHKIFK
jgi:hypothetical protein